MTIHQNGEKFPRMQLKDYLRESHTSIAQLAMAVGVAPNVPYRWLSGKQLPSRKVMYRIITATAGAVTANDFYEPPSVNQFTPGE